MDPLAVKFFLTNLAWIWIIFSRQFTLIMKYYRDDDRFLWQNAAVYRIQYCILIKANFLKFIKDKAPCYIFSLLCVSVVMHARCLLKIMAFFFFPLFFVRQSHYFLLPIPCFWKHILYLNKERPTWCHLLFYFII